MEDSYILYIVLIPVFFLMGVMVWLWYKKNKEVDKALNSEISGSILKKWWFWLILIPIILGLIYSCLFGDTCFFIIPH